MNKLKYILILIFFYNLNAQELEKNYFSELEVNMFQSMIDDEINTIFEEGEAGILLDNTAIDILVKETLTMIAELSIKQAKGYMYVDEIEVDYNDSNKMMRIKRSPEQANPEPNSDYAVYFYVK